MLPGIRFLLAAIVLSMSILIFGLGAAALLRAAHEEVASVPTRRVMPEPVFAQQPEPAAPTLALLRVEPAAPETMAETPPAALPAPEPAPEAVPVPQVETEKLAALKLEDAAPAEAAKPEPAAQPEIAAKPETLAPEKPGTAAAEQSEIATTELPAAAPDAPEPAASPETKIAAIAASPAPSAEVTPPAFELIATPAMTEPGITTTKAAALGSPAAKVEQPTEAKKAIDKPDRAEIRKQQAAERARERRRQAARRARLAAQQAAAATAQQAADPFSQLTQPAQQATTTATTRRRQ